MVNEILSDTQATVVVVFDVVLDVTVVVNVVVVALIIVADPIISSCCQ